MNNKDSNRTGRPRIDRLFGEDPVLDILHIAFVDFKQGRLTKIRKIIRIMNYTYPGYQREYLKRLISITINSHWFRKPNLHEVHLIEPGVEVYLSMVQNYRAEKWARDVSYKTNAVIVISILGLIATIVFAFYGK